MPASTEQYDQALLDRIRDILVDRKQTVSVAESVTAGQLQVALSLAETASEFFQGGITTYNLGQKTRHLDVEPISALSCDCVSGQVARQMAKQVCERFLSDWGIAITGYATPVPEKNIHELFAWVSICFRGKEVLLEKMNVENNAPLTVRLEYTHRVLKSFHGLLSSGAE